MCICVSSTIYGGSLHDRNSKGIHCCLLLIKLYLCMRMTLSLVAMCCYSSRCYLMHVLE